jgi:hypothetical protein
MLTRQKTVKHTNTGTISLYTVKNKYNKKMNFTQMQPLNVGIFAAYNDYNLVSYCLKSAIKKNKMQLCRNINDMEIAERVVVLLFQVANVSFKMYEYFTK